MEPGHVPMVIGSNGKGESVCLRKGLIFATLGYIGYKTDKDLSSWGTYLTVFLIAGLILSILNLFIFKSTGFELILDWFILAVFFGVTIYDINKIKTLENDPDLDTNKIHIYLPEEQWNIYDKTKKIATYQSTYFSILIVPALLDSILSLQKTGENVEE